MPRPALLGRVLTVSATRTIDAPRETVFAFLDEPPNQVRVTPSLIGVGNVEPKAGGGKRLVYGYRTFGVVFTGSLETTTYDPPERIVFQMDGDVVGTITWEVEAADAGTTRFTYTAEYDLSVFPGAQFARPLFAWYNRREVQTTLQNVQRLVEGGDISRGDVQLQSAPDSDSSYAGSDESHADSDHAATDSDTLHAGSDTPRTDSDHAATDPDDSDAPEPESDTPAADE